MKIGAVVLHYRNWPAVSTTLEHLLGGSRRPDVTVVVDNCSGDGSVASIAAAFPEVEVVEPPANLGYPAGMNLGAGRLLRAGVDAVLLLAHDCCLAGDALALLEERLEQRASLGVVGPLTGFASHPDEVYSSGCALDPRTWQPSLGRSPARMADWAGHPPQPCEWVNGSCLLVRADALRQVGPIDEAYFLYFEEVDYQFRLRERGWGVECLPQALAWQEPGRIPLELWVRNRLRFLARHAPRRALARDLALQAKRAAGDARRRDWRRLRTRVRAVTHFFLGRGGPPADPVLEERR